MDAAHELTSLCSSAPSGVSASADAAAADGGGADVRKRVRSLMLRMEGVVTGARSCLPDFALVVHQGKDSSQI